MVENRDYGVSGWKRQSSFRALTDSSGYSLSTFSQKAGRHLSEKSIFKALSQDSSARLTCSLEVRFVRVYHHGWRTDFLSSSLFGRGLGNNSIAAFSAGAIDVWCHLAKNLKGACMSCVKNLKVLEMSHSLSPPHAWLTSPSSWLLLRLYLAYEKE